MNLSNEMEEKLYLPEELGFHKKQVEFLEPGDIVIWRPNYMWRDSMLVEFEEDAYQVKSIIHTVDGTSVVIDFSDEPIDLTGRDIWIKSIKESYVLMYVPLNFTRAVVEAGGKPASVTEE